MSLSEAGDRMNEDKGAGYHVATWMAGIACFVCLLTSLQAAFAIDEGVAQPERAKFILSLWATGFIVSLISTILFLFLKRKAEKQ